MKTGLITGATGATGKALLYLLLEDDSYEKVIAVSRRPIPIKHPKLQQVMVDFDRLENFAGELKADDVYCCLGTTIKKAGTREQFYKADHDYVCSIARIAKQGGAKQFIMVSALGANERSAVFYNKVKGETERDVAALGYETFIVVRPSLLIAKRVEFRLGETLAKYVMLGTSLLFIGPLKKYKAIPVETVALAMRTYAARGLKGKHIFLNDALFEAK